MKHLFMNPVIIGIAALSLFSTEIQACSCVRTATCHLASMADAVFVGTVGSQTETAERNKEYGYEERFQISRLTVEEDFLGADGVSEITVQTDIASSCAFPLKAGETYVVYAVRSDSTTHFVTGMCSGTKPVSAAGVELESLRSERGKLSTVSGTVTFDGAGKLSSQRLKESGVTTVKLIGEANMQEAKIDSGGSYEFRGIPNGKYRIEVGLPDSLIIEGDYRRDVAAGFGIGDQNLFKLSGLGCFTKHLSVRENGRIGGRLTDDLGMPVAGVQVTAVPVDKQGRAIKQPELCYSRGHCIASKEDGSYLFQGLKPGRYLIGVRLDDYLCNDCSDAEFKKAFYPGVTTELRAKPIVVGLGTAETGIDLKLTGKYIERQIAGSVVLKDGRPAANVAVRYVARTPDLKQNSITFIQTDANGNFTIDAYDGHSYLIGAFTDIRHGNDRAEAKAVVLRVSLQKAVPAIRLVLDQASTDDDYSGFPTKKAQP